MSMAFVFTCVKVSAYMCMRDPIYSTYMIVSLHRMHDWKSMCDTRQTIKFDMDCISVCTTVQQFNKLVMIYNKSNLNNTLSLWSSSSVVNTWQSFLHPAIVTIKIFLHCKGLSLRLHHFLSCFLQLGQIFLRNSLYGSSFKIKSIVLLTSIHKFLAPFSSTVVIKLLSLLPFTLLYSTRCFVSETPPYIFPYSSIISLLADSFNPSCSLRLIHSTFLSLFYFITQLFLRIK